MFNISALELTVLVIWAIGVAIAVALILSKNLNLRTRIIVLIAALALPIFGSIPVIAYGAYIAVSARGNKQLKNQGNAG